MLRILPLRYWALICVVIACAACFISGCGSTPANPPASTPGTTGQANESLVVFFAAPKQSGAALWSANCNRCHNAVGPSAFRPDEWDLILNHMRLAPTSPDRRCGPSPTI